MRTRARPTFLVARREYTTRVRTKAFWLSTILLPAFMGAMVFLPSLILLKSGARVRLAVVDGAGRVGPALVARLAPGELAAHTSEELATVQQGPLAKFEIELRELAADPAAQRAALDREVLGEKIDAWLWISPQSLVSGEVEYHAESVSNFLTQRVLERALTEVVSSARLSAAGLDSNRIRELIEPVELSTVRISAAGSRAEAGMAGFFLAYFLFFLLYLVVVIYGQQVMNGVLEEKSTRIVEVIVSSVRPFELMLGKLVGIGAVGLTQLAIWLLAMAALTAPAVVGAIIAMPAGYQLPQVSGMVIVHFVLHFLLGYFLFASLYAALGAACNNIQEAQQLASVLVFFLVAPVLLLMPVINDPDSPLAVVSSLIPFFTPLLMMLRIAVKTPPAWQILAGYLITALFTVGMVWACARIYRVGILMYGKRPTFRELWRWLRYA